ncbi:MAG: methyl-accepting chemotaxis protein [Coleofasciculaceae cyanobacterium]
MPHPIIPSSVHTHPSEVDVRLNPGSKQNQQTSWKRLNLRLKATMLAAAMSLLPLLAVGTIDYAVTHQLEEKEIEKREQRLATNLQSNLNNFMRERYGDIQIMANNEVFTNPRLRQTMTNEEKAQSLEKFLDAYPIYDSVAVFNIKGDTIAQTKGKPLGNFSDRSYIQAALRTQKPVITQPTISAFNGGFSIFSAAPIKDKVTGEVIGTIRARMPLENLSKWVPGIQAKDGSAYYLINASGEVFYGPEGQYVSKVNTIGDRVTSSETTYKQNRIEELFPSLRTIKETQQAGSTLGVHPVTKTKQLVTYVPPAPPLKGLEELKWSVVLTTEESVAFAAHRQLLLIVVSVTGLTVVIVAAISIYLVNRAVRPILMSAWAVEKIGQGELDTRIPVKGEDELAILGVNINRMAAQIQEQQMTLQQNALQLQQQNDVLSELARNEAVIQGNAKAAAKTFTEAIAQTLNLERVGIWLYNSDSSNLICLDHYDSSLQEHFNGAILNVDDSPEYFLGLKTESFIAVNDVQNNPATHALVARQLVSADTQLLVSVPIQIGDRIVGFIQCEEDKISRIWQADEQRFVASVANFLSIVLESEFLQQEVSNLLDVVSQVEEGDLTAQAQVSNRITGLVADTLNRFIERLTDVLNQVLTVSHQVSQGAYQQTELAETVATNAELQAQEVGQVLNLTEQVEEAAQASTKQAKASNESLQAVFAKLMQGQDTLNELTRGITVLQEGTDRIVQRMKTLREFVGLADQFVQNQNQIAFITQTLSLNASLVAARASEQRDPRQFVVVAREFDSIAEQVSKLAQQTSEGLTVLEQQSAQIHNAVSAVDGDVQGLGDLVRQFTTGVEQSNLVFDHVQMATGEAMQAGEVVAHFSLDIVEAAQTTASVMRDIAGLANKTAELTQIARERSEQMDLLSAQLLHTVQFFQLPSTLDKDNTARVESDAFPLGVTSLQDSTLPIGNTYDERSTRSNHHLPVSSKTIAKPVSNDELT